MGKGYVYLQVHDEIGTIFINRPKKRNALTVDMWRQLISHVEQCDNDKNVKVIIIRSTTNEAFSAGADISEFATVRNSIESVMEFNKLPMTLEKRLANCSKPSIAMISGFCIGGGCEIAIACDFRFADFTSKFAITPAKLGIVYNTPGTKNLVDLVGPSNAKDLLFTGRMINAEEAREMGLINKVVSHDNLERITYEFATQIANNAQLTVRSSKKIITDILHGATEDSEEVVELIKESIDSSDYKEGVAAFLQKRKPNFTYR
ncbi:enoyl-CoA hydratase/isomerase family protein [Bacillus kwashiorkori]|uniref:enoyl-CoA hydratase/isomerase family protein n=1 Tax=Bacillus kwashiorkori TaxID=1522318 RepID=UPI00078241B5|nr:enoyl-CoA hydratase-related protein [Bacillus kwashiorkori]